MTGTCIFMLKFNLHSNKTFVFRGELGNVCPFDNNTSVVSVRKSYDTFWSSKCSNVKQGPWPFLSACVMKGGTWTWNRVCQKCLPKRTGVCWKEIHFLRGEKNIDRCTAINIQPKRKVRRESRVQPVQVLYQVKEHQGWARTDTTAQQFIEKELVVIMLSAAPWWSSWGRTRHTMRQESFPISVVPWVSHTLRVFLLILLNLFYIFVILKTRNCYSHLALNHSKVQCVFIPTWKSIE